jgi:hypothetical protein
MANFRKVTVVPFENEQNVPMSDAIHTPQAPSFITSAPPSAAPMVSKKRNAHFDKLTRLLKIILKLANIEGYNQEGKIKTPSGDYLMHSDIVSLLNHAMTVGRVLIGEQEFIKLLYKAQIEPDLIVNENVKSKLSNLYDTQVQPNNNMNDVEMPKLDGPFPLAGEPVIYENIRPPKRKPENDDSQIGWVVPEKQSIINHTSDVPPPAKKQKVEEVKRQFIPSWEYAKEMSKDTELPSDDDEWGED